MSFLGLNLAPLGKKLQDIEGDVGRFFGGGQPQAPAPLPTMPQRQAAANIGSSLGIGPMAPPSVGLSALPAPPPPPPKPKVTLSSAQQRAQATLNALGGPVDPNIVSPNPGLGAMALEAGKGLVAPVVDPYNNMNAANTEIDAKAQPGLAGNLNATAAKTVNFAKAIGQSGVNAAAYVAPELKLIKGGAEASPIVKAAVGLINHGASSAPISVAGSLANGDTNPVDIAKNAAIASLTAGVVPGLKDAGVRGLPAAEVHAAGPEGLPVPKPGEKPSVAQLPIDKPKVKYVETPAGRVKVTPDIPTPKDWPTDGMPPPLPKSKQFTEKQRAATGNANPVKIDVPEVKAGDHAAAIVNSQRVADRIDKTSSQALRLSRDLKPEDQKLMPRAIEHPELVKTAKEPEKLARAIEADRLASDTAHATNMAVKGEPTAYRKNYALHDWELPEDIANSADTFRAVNEMARIHPTIEHGEAAGLKLKGRSYPEAQAEYYQRASNALRKQALEKGIGEADGPEAKLTEHFNGMKVSAEAKKALRGMERAPQKGKVAIAHDAINKTLKQTLLSISQFHPINIGRKASSTLVLTGHPVRALTAVRDGALAINKHYSDGLHEQALKDGTFDDAARIGTPIGVGNDYTVSGGFNPGKHGIGERTIFEQQMPAMHIQMVKAVVADLKKRGIDLDSPEARQAGNRVNEIMGYVNKEVRGLDAGHQRFLSRILLAPQFTRSKWATLKGVATDQGLARQYAIAAVVGDTAAVYGISAALGALFGQKEDNWRDTMIRALIHPSVVTPFKDGKGNNIELDLPSSYISEAVGLIANLSRGKEGRLGVDFHLQNLPQNLANYGRARLAPLEGDVLKLGTNESYAGKPLYDPNASMGTKATQAATTLAEGHLPIGAQGLAHTGFVKGLLPKASQDVLNAGDSGAPAVAKGVSAAFGLTARTDKTTGKGLETTQYFDQLAKAKQGLDRQASDALDLYTGSKKNPVTGAYDVKPNVNDQRAKATSLLQNPTALDHLVAMNQNLAQSGQKVDPLWGASKDQITKYLQYQAMRPDGPDQKNWRTNNPWYTDLQKQRSTFFDSLPPGDPNKPAAPIEYPQAAPRVQAVQDAYFKLTDPKQKVAFVQAHPELQDQFDKQFKYYNDLSSAQGYTPVKGYPQTTPYIEKQLAARNYKDPRVQNFLNQVSEYNVIQGGANAQFEGTKLSQAAIKGIYSLGNYDISKNPDGSYTLGSPNGGSGGSGGYGSRYKTKLKKFKSFSDGDGVGKTKKVSFKKGSRLAVAGKTKSGKAKVKLSKSLV